MKLKWKCHGSSRTLIFDNLCIIPFVIKEKHIVGRERCFKHEESILLIDGLWLLFLLTSKGIIQKSTESSHLGCWVNFVVKIGFEVYIANRALSHLALYFISCRNLQPKFRNSNSVAQTKTHIAHVQIYLLRNNTFGDVQVDCSVSLHMHINSPDLNKLKKHI